MTLFEYMISHPVTTFSTLAAIGIIGYGSITLYNKKQTGASVLLLISIGVMFFLFTSVYKESLRLSKTQTIVVMPNKQNIRLGEDLQPSFCLDGMARNWQRTKNGIISTTQRMHLGRPMRCLSVEEGINLLRQKGASEEQLEAMRKAYELE